MPGPLEGVKVADFTHYAVGPWAVALLGQLGADIIKVEPPEGDFLRHGTPPSKAGMGTVYQTCNLNKRATIILNLHEARDLEIAHRLVNRCDVLVENHRPGYLERRHLGYEEVSKINPRIIYVQSSGYGTRGPYKDMGSANPYGEAISGFASTSGPMGGPFEGLKQGSHMDLTASQYITAAVTAALYGREVTGRGQKVELSQMEASLALGTARAQEYFVSGQHPGPMGSAVHNIAPSEAFKATNGKWINVSAGNDTEWQALCRAVGEPQLAADPRFVTNSKRVEHRRELSELLSARISEKSSQEWLTILEEHGVPCGPYLTYNQVRINPQVRAQEMLVDVDGPWGELSFGGLPWRFSKTPGTIVATPFPGVKTPEILEELGFDRHATTTSQAVKLFELM